MKNNIVLVIVSALLGAGLLIGGFLLNGNGTKVPGLGSIGGDLAPNGYYTLNGVEHWSGTQGFMATSSSVCVFNNPFPNATSTIVSFSAGISSSSPTGTGISVGANQFDLSTTTAVGGYGSSTPALIYGHIVAAGTTGDFVSWTAQRFSSTTIPGNILFTDRGPAIPDGVSPFILNGTQKITYRIASGTPQTFSTYYIGKCNLTVRKG